MARGIARAALRLAVIIALAMIGGELLEILVFAALPPLPSTVEALLDAALLTIVATPFLYLFLVRPLSSEIRRRRTAEEELAVLNSELKEMNRELERRVEQRTADLAATNERLTREIEERRHAEDKTSKSHGFIQSLVESVPYLVMIYDVGARRCAFVNGRVGDLLGYSPELACAEGTDFLRDILEREDYRWLTELGQTGTNAGKLDTTTHEWNMKTRQGEYRRLRVRASVLRRGPGDSPKEILLTATQD